MKHFLFEEIAKLIRTKIRARFAGFGFFANRLRPLGYVSLRKIEPALRSSNFRIRSSFATPSIFKSLIVACCLSSCGYRWQGEEQITLSVPYIIGDDNGQLATEIIHTLAASGVANVNFHSSYQLKVELCSEGTELIGFRINPQKIKGEIKHNLLPTEGRRSLNAKVTLLQADQVIKGPFEVSAFSEYDYLDQDSIEDLTFTDASGQMQTVLPFSLGQLEPLEAAAAAALGPLYKNLAQKIADALFLQLNEE